MDRSLLMDVDLRLNGGYVTNRRLCMMSSYMESSTKVHEVTNRGTSPNLVVVINWRMSLVLLHLLNCNYPTLPHHIT
jgi:hypothetical protein